MGIICSLKFISKHFVYLIYYNDWFDAIGFVFVHVSIWIRSGTVGIENFPTSAI